MTDIRDALLEEFAAQLTHAEATIDASQLVACALARHARDRRLERDDARGQVRDLQAQLRRLMGAPRLDEDEDAAALTLDRTE